MARHSRRTEILDDQMALFSKGKRVKCFADKVAIVTGGEKRPIVDLDVGEAKLAITVDPGPP